METLFIPTLHIRLFGEFSLVSDEAALTTIDLPRQQSLLAYLLLHRTAPQSRAHLAYLLWPDSTEGQALTNLRNLVHKLRQGLPHADAFLSIDRQALQWRPNAPWTLDVLEFEQALAEAEQGERSKNSMAVRQALEKAVEVYRGDLLPSCYDEWILPERDRLRQAFLKSLERLIGLLEQERDYSAAISVAQRLLRYDPLNEPTYRYLMRLYAVSGDRAAALRTYHTCVTVLEQELGTEPGRITRQMYERLLQTEEVVGEQAEKQSAPLVTAPLIGRKEEWIQLQTAWRNAAAGNARMVVLAGEAGIGKTRLAEELLIWVGRQGITTATARCYPAEGELAYAPLASWLRSDGLRGRLATLSDNWLSEVARVRPDVLAERPDLPQPGPLTESWQRQHLFEALARTVVGGESGGLSTRQPILLLLDDLQWCDRETLEWLHYLLRFDLQAPLLLIGTIRSEEIADGHPLSSLLVSLRRARVLTEITPEPLNASDVVSLARHIAGHDLAPTLAADLYQETEGNPLFVVEMVRSGLLEQEKNAYTADSEISTSSLPPTLQAVIAARLGQLSPTAREIVNVAAVIGRAFTFSVLMEASGGEEDRLVQGLDELWQRRIVREQGAGSPDTYDFSHDKLREGAYASLSAVRRRLLHRRVAQALETVFATQLETVSGRIATHYQRAGLISQAIPYYVQAGEVAMRVYANAEALALFQRALALLEGGSPGAVQLEWRQEMMARLHDYLGDISQRIGLHDEAFSHYEKALASLPSQEYMWQARVHRKMGNIWVARRHYIVALDCFAQAEAALSKAPANDSPFWWQEWLELQYRKIVAHFWLAQVEEITALVEKTRPILEQYGTLALRAAFYLSLAGCNLKDGRFLATEETLEYAYIALKLCEELGDLVQLGWAQYNPGFYHLFLGDLNLAEKYLRDALETSERTGEATLQLRCLTYLALVFRKREQVEKVRQFSLRSLEVATTGNVPEYIGMAKANLAWIAWHEGILDEARQLGEAALGLWRQTATIYPFHFAALWPLMAVALAQGQISEAVRYAEGLFAPQQLRPAEALREVVEAAIEAWKAGQREMVRRGLQQAVSLAKEMGYL